MIARIPGWSWHVRGGGVTLTPPGGRAVGSIRYRERRAPIRPILDIIAAKGPSPGGRRSAIERLVTAEGEYAAVVDLVHPLAGIEVQRTIGVVYADDWYSSISGLARDPEHFERFSALVRQLTASDRLMLGGHRRRRFVYSPPTGWNGWSPLPLVTTWFAPGYPRSRTSLTVYPALPVSPNTAAALSSIPVGPPRPAEIVEPRAAPIDIESGELAGRQWEFVARDARGLFVRAVAILASDRHHYVVHLDAVEAQLDEGQRALAALIASIEPLPVAGDLAPTTDVFDHWV